MSKMKYYLLLLSILCIISCKKETDSITGQCDRENFTYDSIINFCPMSYPCSDLRDTVSNYFLDYYFQFSNLTYEEAKKLKNSIYNIEKKGIIYNSHNNQSYILWVFKLDGSVYNYFNYEFGFIINESRNEYALISLDAVNTFQIKKGEYVIEGYKPSRGRSTFMLYSFQGVDRLKLTFTSPQCVENLQLGCVVFQPFRLVLIKSDFNKDGLIDFQFSGNFLNFCEGFEEGPNFFEGDEIKGHGILRYRYLQRRINDGASFEIDSLSSVFNEKVDY